MASILIQFAHPAFSRSRAQKTLLGYCSGLEGVTVNDLYEQYPDLYIDVRREQRLLLEHDLIILQHPFYWYSGPAILKQWMDLVLEYNWAYGPHGHALRGKKVLSVLSCGSREESYGTEGHDGHPLGHFLLPFRQTARLCRMEYLPPFVIYGTNNIQQESLDEYGRRYAGFLRAFTEDQVNPAQYAHLEILNDMSLTDGGDPAPG